MENPIVSIIFGFVILALYFVPAIIANQRKHKQYNPILLINLFLGWTFIGWLIALIWAVSYQEKKV